MRIPTRIFDLPRFLPTSFLAAIMLGATGGGAQAASETTRVPDYSRQAVGAISFEALSPAGQVEATRALGDFSRATGTRWTVLDYAPATLSPRLALGTGLDLGRPVSDVAEAEFLARDLVATHPDLFATRPDRLEVWKTGEGAGKFSVHFWEVVDGLPVLGTKVTTVFTRDGVLAAFGATTYPTIERAVMPVLAAEDAFEQAHAHLVALGAITADRAAVRWRAEGPYVLPVATTDGRDGTDAPIGPDVPERGADDPAGADGLTDGAVEGRTIRRIVLASEEPAAWIVDVDAVDGTVLQRRSGIFHLDFTGNVSVDVEDPNYCEDPVIRPLSEVEVRIAGVGTALTDANGDYVVANAGTDPATLELTLRSPWVEVTNVDGPSALYTETATPGAPSAILVDDGEARWDERDVFYHTVRTHDMLKGIDANWDDLDFVMPARVNIDQGCNAFYSFADSSINFYRARNGCGNTGQIGDVVAHEYGHAITAELYGENQPSGDLHEGNSDIAANLLFGYSLIGPGFTLDDCENGIRDSDNDLVWPDDTGNGGHFDGQILAGFYWNALEYLTVSHGETAAFAATRAAWYYGRVLGLPQSQPEQAWWSILADDDNGNIDDGTPHFAALCQAAQDKGYACPETFADVVIKHLPSLYASDVDGDHRIDAEIYSLAAPLAAGGVNVHWRPAGGGAFTPVPFAPTGMGNGQEAFIPQQAVLATVEYFILAEDDLGNSLRRPEGNGHYRFQVVTSYHDAEDGAEGWTVGGPEDTATTGVWERVDPNRMTVSGQPAQPGDDMSPDPGVMAWITQQYGGGSPVLSDVDGRTTLYSPEYDVTGAAWVNVQFWRWFQTLVGFLGEMEIAVTHTGGASWETLASFDADDRAPEWQLFSAAVPEPIGGYGTIQFRIVALGAPNPSIDECGLDEWVLIAAESGSPASVPDGEAAGSVRLTLASTNPSRGLVALDYALPESGLAMLAIYGVDGRHVRTLATGVAEAGRHAVTWDGRDDSGRRVGSGVYFVRLSAPGGEDVRRVVIGR